MARITLANGTEINDLDVLVSALASGKNVSIEYPTHMGTSTETFRYAKVTEPDFAPQIFVHGTPASSFRQVASFIDGDAHDRSKVQFYTGKNMKSLF